MILITNFNKDPFKNEYGFSIVKIFHHETSHLFTFRGVKSPFAKQCHKIRWQIETYVIELMLPSIISSYILQNLKKSVISVINYKNYKLNHMLWNWGCHLLFSYPYFSI